MRPASHLCDLARVRALWAVEFLKAGIGIGLQEAGEGLEMLAWPFRLAVGAVEEGCSRRCRALERTIVADIDPGPAGLGASVARSSTGTGVSSPWIFSAAMWPGT